MRGLMEVPSILPSMRSYSCMPAQPFAPSRAWGLAPPPPELSADGYEQGRYRPVLHTFSPRGCLGEVIRRPICIFGQFSIDVIVGGVALGCAIGMFAVGQPHIAQAFLREHGFQVVVLIVTFLATFCMGAALGLGIGLAQSLV